MNRRWASRRRRRGVADIAETKGEEEMKQVSSWALTSGAALPVVMSAAEPASASRTALVEVDADSASSSTDLIDE